MSEEIEMFSGKKKKVKLVLLLLIFIIPLLTATTNNQAANPDPVFSISLLWPNSYGYLWMTIMAEQLPKIGIGIDVKDFTGWAVISSRTWGYPGPYPVPSYSEGGFDVLGVSYGWGLDINFTEMFHSAHITPNDWNFYQYNSSEMDSILGNYSQSFVLADRINYAQDMQALLYEDVPQATVKYPQVVFPHDSDLVNISWNPLLWYEESQDMAYWQIPGQTEFRYAIPASVDVFHPFHIDSEYDLHWVSQIYGGLAERTPHALYNYAFTPYACTSYSTANGINYTIQLDPNLVFADGTKCNASDVKYSYDLLINPNISHANHDFYSQYIDNSTIEIVSEYEIKAHFLQPTPFQENNLGIDILPKHIWESILPENHVTQAETWASSDTFDSNIMGIGPYYLEDYDSLSEIIHLKANPYWTTWGGHTPQNFSDIYFERYSTNSVALSDLDNGVLDMVDADFIYDLDQIPATVDYTKVTIPGSTELAFNMQHPYLGTGELCPIPGPESAKHIRKAISHMIPRDAIVAEIFEEIGSPGVTAFPEGAVGFDESLEPYDYNKDLAINHMRQAGFYVDPSNIGSSVNAGLGLKTILGIIAFVGGCWHLRKAKRKR
jgi:ABC-type transport system substrate-binding protein